jgi:hypothetical protein
MTGEDDTRSQRTATLLETEVIAAIERIRGQLADVPGTDTLLEHLDELDGRRVELRRRLDAMPTDGGAWGMASDTPLAGLADVVLRLEQVEAELGAEPDPASVAAAAQLAADPLPRPVRLMAPQRDLIQRLRQGELPPWVAGPAVS